MPTVLITHDISTDTTRARAAATIQTWGDRIQRSVFVCTLDANDLHDLTEQLRQLVNPRTDSIHIVPLCGTCWNGITTIGQATVQPDTLYWAVP
ncbi:CRISPR-associated endonuclease Cas2 [Micromonospora sp. WMMD734]